MRFEWDPEKDRGNQAKHGISFASAKAVFIDPLHLSVLDERFSYFEERWITVGRIGEAGVVVVAHLYYTDDGDEVVRLISAREATRNELRQYEELR